MSLGAPRLPPAGPPPPTAAAPAFHAPPAARPSPASAAAADDDDGPAAKKARVDPATGLMPAEAWAAQLAAPLELLLVLKADAGAPPEWGLGAGCGTETVAVADCLLATVKQLKDTLLRTSIVIGDDEDYL